VFQALAARGQCRLALIGDGDLAEIARLVARDHPVEVAGIAPASADGPGLSRNLEGLGPLDAVVVTTLERSRETFAAAVELLGAARVYAPALLRVSPLAAVPPAPKGDGR
jgi:hypothetical protein